MAALLNWPNRITLTRTFMIPGFVILILNAAEAPWLRWPALAVLVLMGLGDALDGYLARKWSQQTRLGALLDPLADKLLMTSACILLALDAVVRDEAGTPWLPWPIPNWMVVTIIFRDLLLLVGGLVLMLMGEGEELQPSRLGKLTTVCQTVLLVGTLLGPELKALAGEWFRWCLWAPAFGLTVASGLVYVRSGLYLLMGVPKPQRRRS